MILFQGDVDYIKIQEAIESNPGEYTYSNLNDGFEKLKEAKTVMYEFLSFVRSAYKSNPKTLPNVKLFGAGKDRYFGPVCTRNSPLFPMFKKAAAKTLENGIYKTSSLKWVGREIKSQGAVDTMVLSIGQMFIVFLFMALFSIVSLFILFLECLYFKGPGLFYPSKRDQSENDQQVVPQIKRRSHISRLGSQTRLRWYFTIFRRVIED